VPNHVRREPPNRNDQRQNLEPAQRGPEHVQDEPERVLPRRDARGPVRPGVQRDDHLARGDHDDRVQGGQAQPVLDDGAENASDDAATSDAVDAGIDGR
jgi:hypothetical protein